MKKTKIIATLGPPTEAKHMIEKLIDAGVNVFRLNFSHGDHAEQLARIKTLREIEKETGKPVAILQDLQGPKIRVGIFEREPYVLKNGAQVTLTINDPQEGEIPIQYSGIVNDVIPGNRILLDDGLFELRVISKKGSKIFCKVINGGELTSKKGINLPDSSVSAPPLSEKDKKDLIFGLEHDIDFVALSFIKSSKDIENIRKIIRSKNKNTKIIAKVERHEAVDNIDSIIVAADAIMVARGDLGIEVSQDKVPFIQKEIITKCVASGKPVIVATQMLDSMIRNPRSTRAETSDIANAILDGTDAVMLSGETSAGKFPLNAVKAMKKIALTSERYMIEKNILLGKRAQTEVAQTSDAIGKAACGLVYDLNAKVIINATASGNTTRAVSKYRSFVPIISITHTLKTARELCLVWGVYPNKIDYTNLRDMIAQAVDIAKSLKIVKKGDEAVIISGQKVGVVGGTNMIKVKEIE